MAAYSSAAGVLCQMRLYCCACHTMAQQEPEGTLSPLNSLLPRLPGACCRSKCMPVPADEV